jgi:hypothetical protein
MYNSRQTMIYVPTPSGCSFSPVDFNFKYRGVQHSDKAGIMLQE